MVMTMNTAEALLPDVSRDDDAFVQSGGDDDFVSAGGTERDRLILEARAAPDSHERAVAVSPHRVSRHDERALLATQFDVERCGQVRHQLGM